MTKERVTRSLVTIFLLLAALFAKKEEKAEKNMTRRAVTRHLVIMWRCQTSATTQLVPAWLYLCEPLSHLVSRVLERHENSGFSTIENPSNSSWRCDRGPRRTHLPKLSLDSVDIAIASDSTARHYLRSPPIVWRHIFVGKDYTSNEGTSSFEVLLFSIRGLVKSISYWD